MKDLIIKLSKIQRELKAPKNQRNTFGNYNYRSCEDILEAVKPLLGDLVLTISDDVINVGNRYYIKATAKLTDGTNSIENSALAREQEERKGMDTSQVTGATSSYARKYALNGLLAIDDEKDADTKDNSVKEVKTTECDHDFHEYTSKKEGPNYGRKFKNCSKCKKFEWIKEMDMDAVENWNGSKSVGGHTTEVI